MTLAYVECAQRVPAGTAAGIARPRFRVERFPSTAAALDRAREIIDMPTISAVELYSQQGEVMFDAAELAGALGWRLPPRAAAGRPEDQAAAGSHPGRTSGLASS